MNKASYDFLSRWGDTESVQRLRKSDKSKDVQKAEVENILKEVGFRFERSPNMNTYKYWASDIIDAGYEDWMVKEIAKSIPYKFERYPTLSQITELLRPYLAQVSVSEPDLDKYTRLAIPHLKAKFTAIVGDEAFAKMVNYYRQEVMPESNLPCEIAVLGDWCRSHFSPNPKKIVEQGKLTNKAFIRGDLDYFLRPLKMYAEANKLV